MTRCHHCVAGGQWVYVGFCQVCWDRLPGERRTALLEGRKESKQSELTAVSAAREWLKRNGYG